MAITAQHLGRIRVIAAFTWLEAIRTRLPWIVIGIALALVAVSVFVRSLALTESARVQIGFLSATLRMGAIFMVCLHVLGSQLREAQDRGTELLLSIDITRYQYLAGKVLGFIVVAAGIATVFSVPIVVIAPFPEGLKWWVSLTLETWIIVAAALFCVITFNQLMMAATFVLAFYLLARAMASVVLVSGASYLAGNGPSQAVLTAAVKAIAVVLPGLDQFTRTGWLLGEPAAWSTLARLAGETALYVALLTFAALFDLYRKNH